jgi:hypothetical protein
MPLYIKISTGRSYVACSVREKVNVNAEGEIKIRKIIRSRYYCLAQGRKIFRKWERGEVLIFELTVEPC